MTYLPPPDLPAIAAPQLQEEKIVAVARGEESGPPNSLGNAPLAIAQNPNSPIPAQGHVIPELAGPRSPQLPEGVIPSEISDISALSPLPTITPDSEELSVLEVIGDRQSYDHGEGIVTAQGQVLASFEGGVSVSDHLWVNLPEKLLVAEDEVVLTRGNQTFQGDRFEYYFSQDRGTLTPASGKIDQGRIGTDLNIQRRQDLVNYNVLDRPLSQTLQDGQPSTEVVARRGLEFVLSGGLQAVRNLQTPELFRGSVENWRFEAASADFDRRGWEAQEVRLTNDPFSPPEFEIRGRTMAVEQLAPQVSLLRLRGGHLVFDRWLKVPLFINRLLFDNRGQQGNDLLSYFGYDKGKRGGIYMKRPFTIVDSPRISWTVTPQYFLQKSLFPDALPGFLASDYTPGPGESTLTGDKFGVVSTLRGRLSDRTTLRGELETTSFNWKDQENLLQTNVQVARLIGPRSRPHTLTAEYNYRDLLFNGSLGVQRVQSNAGLVLTSPTYPLAQTGINVRYQLGAQWINANSDRLALLPPNRENNRVQLGRYQGALLLNKTVSILRGQALPATATAGLRYTANPVVPYLNLNLGATGVAGFYSSGDTQQYLSTGVGISGQVGHFSRRFFDYTGFNLSYGRGFKSSESPFLFDRYGDSRTLSWGINQQIFGPIRVGVQHQVNLDTNKTISTDYSFEYSRRSYNILFRYNPVLKRNFLSFRINDFRSQGSGDDFSLLERVRNR